MSDEVKVVIVTEDYYVEAERSFSTSDEARAFCGGFEWGAGMYSGYAQALTIEDLDELCESVDNKYSSITQAKYDRIAGAFK